MSTKPDVCIVTTTIYVPKLLDAYAKDAKKYKHDVLFVVIADKKTPQEAEDFCASLKKRGVSIEYFSCARQEKYLSRFRALKKHLRWNSIQRRNVGMLYAYESGAETIITIDDDNFLVTKNFIGAHDVQDKKMCDVVKTNTGWVNVCALLEEQHSRRFYHRGFPLEQRTPKEKWSVKKARVRVVVNAGLWLGDPDVDAMERLYHLADPTEAVRYTGKRNVALSKGTWSPFNSQNTAIRRDAIPAYFLSPYIGRYDDIWASYIIKHIADHMHDSICFGEPIVEQKRNPHNYWKDFDQERYGHALTLRFVHALSRIKLSHKTYRSCFKEITARMPSELAKEKMSEQEKEFFVKFFEGLRIWRDVFSSL